MRREQRPKTFSSADKKGCLYLIVDLRELNSHNRQGFFGIPAIFDGEMIARPLVFLPFYRIIIAIKEMM